MEEDLQAKWTLLLASTQQKFGYWLSLQYPSDVRQAASRLDTILWGMFEKAAGFHIPMMEEGKGVECVLNLPVNGLQGQSFQGLMARLPIKERGMGLRSMVDTIPAAFLGSAEMSLSFLTGEGGQCQILEPCLGDIRAMDTKTRWRVLLQSGNRTSREFQGCWALLQREGEQCAAYLGETLSSHLAEQVEGVGDRRLDGSTRRLLTEQREKLRARVIYRALTLHLKKNQMVSCTWLLSAACPNCLSSPASPCCTSPSLPCLPSSSQPSLCGLLFIHQDVLDLLSPCPHHLTLLVFFLQEAGIKCPELSPFSHRGFFERENH